MSFGNGTKKDLRSQSRIACICSEQLPFLILLADDRHVSEQGGQSNVLHHYCLQHMLLIATFLMRKTPGTLYITRLDSCGTIALDPSLHMGACD